MVIIINIIKVIFIYNIYYQGNNKYMNVDNVYNVVPHIVSVIAIVASKSL